MGCFFSIGSESNEINDLNLHTIKESLGELGMPNFNPPIPSDHKEVVVQYLKSCDGERSRPTKTSTVELNYCGWISEEGDLWRRQTEDTRFLSTSLPWNPTAMTGELAKTTILSTPSFQGDRNLSLQAVKTKSQMSDNQSSCASLMSLVNKKSTLYGKCYDYTESWKVHLGAEEVIRGLEEVILGMSVDDEVISFIPSKLAYAEKGYGELIPPNADLVVKVTLKRIIEN